MKLTVLGNSAAYPGPNDPCSGYLVQDEGGSILVDCGSGVLGNLQTHIDLRDISDIFISHMHADHFFDLIPYRYGLKYGPGGSSGARPRLHLPPGGTKAINQVVAPFSESAHFFSAVFDVDEFDPKSTLSAVGLEVAFVAVRHYIPTYAISVTGSSRLVYSSDSGQCPELIQIAKDSDLLLCTVGGGLGEDIGNLWGHLLPSEAGVLARDAAARRLLLTHFWPSCNRQAGVNEASLEYGHQVEAAETNRSYTF